MELKYQPLVTIIVPVYNSGKYLCKCVDSLINQTYDNLEIILVDDGSTDNSPSICDMYSEKDKRVVVIHKKNGGLSSARNAGLDASKGEFIGFVDSDDYVDLNMYSILVATSVKSNSEVVNCAIMEEREDGKIVSISISECFSQDTEKYIESLLLHKGDVAMCSKLIKKELLHNLRFDETKNNEDLLFMIELSKRIKQISFNSGTSYHYVIHEETLSRKFGKTMYDMLDNALIFEKYINDNLPNLKKQAERFVLCQFVTFIWCVPITHDRKKDEVYCQTIKYIRLNFFQELKNEYLSKKDLLKLIAVFISPKLSSYIRQIYMKKNLR